MICFHRNTVKHFDWQLSTKQDGCPRVLDILASLSFGERKQRRVLHLYCQSSLKEFSSATHPRLVFYTRTLEFEPFHMLTTSDPEPSRGSRPSLIDQPGLDYCFWNLSLRNAHICFYLISNLKTWIWSTVQLVGVELNRSTCWENRENVNLSSTENGKMYVCVFIIKLLKFDSEL